MSVLPTSVWLNDNTPLFQPYGSGGGSAISTFTEASISSLTVSSINGLPATNFDTADWSIYPAIQNVNLGNSSIQGVVSVFGRNTGAGTNPLSVDAGNINTLNLNGSNIDIASYSPAGKISFTNSFAEIGSITPAGLSINAVNAPSINASTIAASTITANTLVALSTVNAISTLSTVKVTASDVRTLTLGASNIASLSLATSNATISSIGAQNISTVNFTTSNINTSTINGNELIVSTIVLESTIQAEGGSFSNLSAQAFSTIGASIQQGLMSSIVFNPSISPQFNVDLGMGNFLATLGAGLFGVAVAVPTTAGTITYGLTKGLASLFEQKPVNNITANTFEVYNYQTQLQTSTLGNRVSTIYSFLSTIPSTVVINTSNINSTISSVEYPFYFSTLSGPNPTCMRSIADPVQTVSTPWTYEQGFGQWVEIPSGGIASNVSTLSLSTLQLLPSTLLKGDANGAKLEVIESATGDYGEVQSAGYWVSLNSADPNFGILARGTNNNPVWIDSNIASNPFALQGKGVQFSSIGIQTSTPQTLLDVGSLNYSSPTSLATFGGNRDGTLEVTLQNKSTGSNASAFFFAVDDTGNEFGGFGVNSLNLSNLYSTLFELPGASIQSGTLDVVIGPQSDHSSNSGIYLTYQDGALAHHINSNGALSFNASYDGTVSEGNFGTSNSVLVTNGPGAPPSWASNINVNQLGVSTLAVNSYLDFNNNIFTNAQFITAGVNNLGVWTTETQVSPFDELNFIRGMTNSTINNGYICLAPRQGLMGVNKIPDTVLDVSGTIQGNALIAPVISTTATTLDLISFNAINLQANGAVNVGSPAGSANGVLNAGSVNANTATISSVTISSITQEILLDSIPHSTCTLIASQNWDYFVNSWGAYPGRQAVQGGYFINTSNATTGGNGFGTFIFPPPGLSSLQTISGTYFTNSSNPGINTPIWLGNGSPGTNGNFSTINVYGDIGRDVFVSYLGYI